MTEFWIWPFNFYVLQTKVLIHFKNWIYTSSSNHFIWLCLLLWYIVGAYSRNIGQHSILARKGTKNFTPFPYSVPFLSVLHQNKALYNFCKRGQCSIVEYNIGLCPDSIWKWKESQIKKKMQNLYSKFKFDLKQEMTVMSYIKWQ